MCTLIIDAGHGGKDPGGGSCELFAEKNMNLQISLYQQNRFKQLGIEAAITRKDDSGIDAFTRANKVRMGGYEYCISNHINAAKDKNVSGAEAIHSIYTDGKIAHEFMKQLTKDGQKTRRVFCKNSEENKSLDYYYMHRDTGKTKTIIVEYGFATNDGDSKKISVLWKKYAESIVRGFCIFNNIDYKPPEKVNEKLIPTYKDVGIKFLYDNGLLTDPKWRENPDQPLPTWAIGLIVKRLGGK